MQKRVVAIVAILAGCLVLINGFVDLNSISSQVWRLVGYTNVTAYLEIGFGGVGVIAGVILSVSEARQRV